MEERIFFLSIPENSERKIIVHAHIPDNNSGVAFLFLGSFFDEKKRMQRFEAETARQLSNVHCHVFRFDYYGTGDSYGDLFEFNVADSIRDVKYILQYIKNMFSIHTIHLLGTRIGADLAVLIAIEDETIQKLYLIEPIVKGRRFLLEQKIKKQSFHKLNDMSTPNNVIINEVVYEDYQGYLLSKSDADFIESINTDEVSISGRNIYLFKLDTFFSKKIIRSAINNLEQSNNLIIKQVDCKDFWASLENINTNILTNDIVSLLN